MGYTKDGKRRNSYGTFAPKNFARSRLKRSDIREAMKHGEWVNVDQVLPHVFNLIEPEACIRKLMQQYRVRLGLDMQQNIRKGARLVLTERLRKAVFDGAFESRRGDNGTLQFRLKEGGEENSQTGRTKNRRGHSAS